MNYAEIIRQLPGIVAYWRLDEASGTTAKDCVGTNHGTYSGGFTLNQSGATRDCNGAVAFDGTGYVAVPDATPMDLGDTFTILLWCKRAAGDIGVSGTNLINKDNSAFNMEFNANNTFKLRKVFVGDVCTSTATITDTTTWHMIGCAKNAATRTTLMLDGVDVSGTVTNQTMADNGSALAIGAFSGGGTTRFTGSMDDVALLKNTALTAAQMAFLYNAVAQSQTPRVANRPGR